jgi:phosphoribosyl 1,2-cyclic phosphodiesterase
VKIKFWGTRGSLPQGMAHDGVLSIINEVLDAAEKKGLASPAAIKSGLASGVFPHPLSYGGNTSCIEVSDGEQLAFVDMGSGLREAGTYHLPSGRKEFHVFLTHMHWDHVMGLPFFVPVHIPGYTIKIYHVHRNAPEAVKINFNGVNFPLTFEQLGGKIEFIQLKLYDTFHLGNLKVTPFVLDHPGGSFGYRFDGGGRSCSIGVDGEFKRISRGELGKDLPFYQNLDLLVFDAQYEISELASRFDWGHCSPNIGVDLALREAIRTLAFTHHDPWATPAKLRRMYQSAVKHASSQMSAFQSQWDQVGQPTGPKLITAWDGLTIDLDKA